MKRFFHMLAFCLALSLPAYTSEGFESSAANNIFYIGFSRGGGTASLVNLPSGEQVITTQAHVIDGITKDSRLKLTWGKKYGRFFLEWEAVKDSFEIEFLPEILWIDNDLDIAFLKVPIGLAEVCKCKGLYTVSYHEGSASMIGYPQTGVRTYPKVGSFWKHLGALLGIMEQRKSNGKTWISGAEYVADLDGLPGNSGSSILDSDGKVIGMLHILKSWYGEGYRYKNPSINLLPTDIILENYQRYKRVQ